MLDNSSNIFNTSVNITAIHPMNKDAIWPKNTEICITRIPIRKKDGFSSKQFAEFALKLKNHMARNGVVFLLCYAPTEDKARPFEICNLMNEAGFTHIDNIIIKKTWFPGKRSENTLVNSHEYVLHFCNGDVWKLDRLPIRTYLGIEDETTCPGNTWEIDTGSLDEAYPADLAELLVRMTDCLPGSIVFDPYMGGSASLKAALLLGHSFFGFEASSNSKKTEERLKKYKTIVDDHSSKLVKKPYKKKR